MDHFFAATFADNTGKLAMFLVMLSLLVVFHEYGHYLLARLNGVRVNDFAVGFGPTLLKWTSPRTGTNYRINLLPLGGYCAMQGEDGKTSEAQQQREFRSHPDALTSDNFQSKTPWQRLAIVLAGPIANFILAFGILFIGAMTFGIVTNKYSTTIGPITPGSPGDRAGLHVGDRVVAINGEGVTNGETFVQIIRNSPGKPVALKIDRFGRILDVTVTPKPTVENGKTIGRVGFVRIADRQRVGFVQAAVEAKNRVWDLLDGNVRGIWALVTKPKQNFEQTTSVIGMERQAAMVQDLGWGPYLDIAAAISMALGVFNLLPFPALDGGRAVFIIAELLRGRPVDREKEALVHIAGFALLMILMVVVASKDIANIVQGKGVF